MADQEYLRRASPRGLRAARLARLLIAGGLIMLALWLALSITRLAAAGRSLLVQQQRLETMLDAGILSADPHELDLIVSTIRHDVTEIRRFGGPLAAIGANLGWLPTVGPILADSRHLLAMADAGSEMAVHGLDVLSAAIDNNQKRDGTFDISLPTLIAVLDDAEQQLIEAEQAAERMFEARTLLEHESAYPDRLATLLIRFDENAGLISDGLKLTQIAPELLGIDRPKTYLVLAQNEDELRPTGGFISGAGRLAFDKGQIVDLAFENASLIDDWQSKPYDLPPEPFIEYMGMDIFLFRDANFWPDFPQSAAKSQALYTYGQDVPLDGVVAIDQQFLQQLLEITGPLPIVVLDRVVDANNVIEQLREEWGPGDGTEDWIVERKAFMGPLADAFRTRLDDGLLEAKGFELAEMFQAAAQQRHLQLYSAEPEVAVVLSQTSWSGRMVRPAAGDFVHVSDTNMGFNKVNAVVERSFLYHVNLDDVLGHTAQLDVHYSNPPALENFECVHGTPYNSGTQYESLTIDCLWNYVRVYVPKGSYLTWASSHPVAAANLMSALEWPGAARSRTTEDGSLTEFDNFILLEPGQDLTVSFQYNLPNEVLTFDGDMYSYQLHVRKQAGTDAESARLRVTVPAGAKILEASPRPAAIHDNSVEFALQLTHDAHIDVLFQK